MPNSSPTLAANKNSVKFAIPEWLYGPTHKVPITLLAAYNNDPQKYPEEQILGLMLGIRMTGYIPPLSITSTGTMLMGGQWVEAAKRLGITEVPVVVVDLKFTDAPASWECAEVDARSLCSFAAPADDQGYPFANTSRGCAHTRVLAQQRLLCSPSRNAKSRSEIRGRAIGRMALIDQSSNRAKQPGVSLLSPKPTYYVNSAGAVVDNGFTLGEGNFAVGNKATLALGEPHLIRE